MSMLAKLRDQTLGSYYELTAPATVRDQLPTANTVILKGSFADGEWDIIAGQSETEELPAGCCLINGYSVTHPVAQLNSPSGKDHFTNEEVLSFLNGSYNEIASLPEMDVINLTEIRDLARAYA